jgi:hypothetical protein
MYEIFMEEWSEWKQEESQWKEAKLSGILNDLEMLEELAVKSAANGLSRKTFYIKYSIARRGQDVRDRLKRHFKVLR